ncbi:S9 family peptidase [Alicyclobacillus sp. SP_1]|uniref:S9 family peptidase n=1 Tax=Alicyclobacillus sp. SP_1 TaxID=2942475 RepID=UPI00215753B4|nr:S9 family peptidase [Alicyclobacillus sp. SP_1]
MSETTTAPYGNWKSPITSDVVVQGTTPLVSVQLDGDNLFFAEAHPSEAGRNTVFCQSRDGRIHECTPAPFNVRTRVHEYGGGAFTAHEGNLYFSNFADNLLYVRTADGDIRKLTDDGNHRYADGIVDGRRKHWIGVREDHTKSAIFAETTLVRMNLDGSDEKIIVSGNDFYSNPRLSDDGQHLCWTTWNHPNMPWDETELWIADLTEDGALTNERKVAGGKGESVVEPVWSPDGHLYYISDRSNWWNLYRWDGDSTSAVCPMEAEFSSPSWVFGMSHYDFVNKDTIVCSYTQNGTWYLAELDTASGEIHRLDSPYTVFGSIHSNGQKLVYLAASPSSFSVLIESDADGKHPNILRTSAELTVSQDYLSQPESIEFPTTGGKTAHAIYYPPHNPDFTAPAGEKPPLLVHVHGGPTSSSSSALNLSTQYWTSHGFAVVDVNYGGSSGYGREYRDRLKGQWGIVDVDDCVHAALYLVERGDVDGARIAIAGGSAGGYTTLAALTFCDVFQAGASYFGLSELEIFAQETHKFESRYMDSLLGPYPAAKDVYYQRSPIHFTDQLSCPVIFFQGLDDKIVPPNQAELMVEALRNKKLPVAYVAYEGEGHGFRMAQNIKHALDSEFYFYGKIFGYTPADPIEPVTVENLD